MLKRMHELRNIRQIEYSLETGEADCLPETEPGKTISDTVDDTYNTCVNVIAR